MSGGDYIPLELQIEIMKRLPIKSLMKFRSVSKPWKSIIHSSQFVSDYNAITHTHKLPVSFYDQNYVYIFDDDDSFPQHKFALTIPVSVYLDYLEEPNYNLIGYSQGLFAFYDSVFNPSVAVIWNPSIRKHIDISIPNVLEEPYDTVFGFGVCNATDPMIVKINYIPGNEFFTMKSIPWQVEVFKLSTGKWRSLSNTSCLPRISVELSRKVSVTDRFMYWIATDRTPVVNGFLLNTLILSFDITSEVFMEIYLPPSLACMCRDDLDLSKVNESLVVLETDIDADNIQEYGVWMMDSGVENSFRKLYTVKALGASIERLLGFRKNGQPVVKMQYDSDEQNPIFVYEPETQRFSDIGISGNVYSCFAGSYMGTLLLLDH